MKLFPHAMIRISGGPFEKLESLNLADSIQIIDVIIDHKKKLGILKQTISEELYSIIPKLQDPSLQNLMVKVRRDIFNERRIASDKITKIIPHLPSNLVAPIENYCQLKEEINHLSKEGEMLFSKEVTDSRGKLKTLALDENFRKGLLLGSQSLYKRIPEYTAKAPSTRLKKKDAQTERGITRYFSRMHSKTSPFSTFTNLAIGKITPDPQPLLPKNQISPFVRLKDQEKAQVVYHIRLNNYLYSYLKVLLTKSPKIYRHLLIRPNPTIQKHEDHYLYLTNSNNIEAFQRIPANPALEVFLYLSSEKKEGLVYKDLIRSIIDNEYIDAPVEDLEAFVNQLIEYGFLEFDLGVSGIDPDWDKKLNKKLIHLEKELPLIKELLDTLESVRRLAERYGSSNCDERMQILEDAFQQFRTICMKLHEDAGLPADERKSPEELRKIQEEKKKTAGEAKKEGVEEDKEETSEGESESIDPDQEDQPFKQFGNTFFNFKPEKMFYEDTSIDNVPQLDEGQILEYIDCLHRLLQKMIRFEGHYDERQKMLYYFVNKYGEKASIDLLTFYEDYYREYKKPEALKQEAQKKENPEAQKIPELPRIPALEEKQEKNKKWMEQFKTLFLISQKSAQKEQEFETLSSKKGGSGALCCARGGETVKLYLHHLEQIEAALDEKIPQDERDCSYGSFIQFFVEKDKAGQERLMGALNASFPGFGKMISRFLHIFDAAVTDDMRTWNQSLLNENRIFLEDSDASFFNANLHPPLMPHEIHMPNGQQSLPPENQIPITELQVKVDETGSRLQLLHTPTQKKVYVFDLGFQGHMGRSQLFQLLEKFTLIEYLFCAPMINALNSIYGPPSDKPADKPAVRSIPRIVYEDRIVLQRRTWHIPEELLPLRKPEENDWAWFLRVNEWRRQLGIPDEVFIFVVDRMTLLAPRPQTPEKKQTKKNTSPDDYKPQYISFQNPFLMDLLEKAMARVPKTLKIVEMLPNSQQLLSLGSHHHIMEFVIQWYSGGKG